MLEPIQQGKLIDKDGPQGEPLRVDQALGRHLAVAIEDAFELLVKVLDGCGAQLVEDATHFMQLPAIHLTTGCDESNDGKVLVNAWLLVYYKRFQMSRPDRAQVLAPLNAYSS